MEAFDEPSARSIDWIFCWLFFGVWSSPDLDILARD